MTTVARVIKAESSQWFEHKQLSRKIMIETKIHTMDMELYIARRVVTYLLELCPRLWTNGKEISIELTKGDVVVKLSG